MLKGGPQVQPAHLWRKPTDKGLIENDLEDSFQHPFVFHGNYRLGRESP